MGEAPTNGSELDGRPSRGDGQWDVGEVEPLAGILLPTATTDADGVIRHATPAFERLFGVGAGVVNGIPLLTLCTQEDRAQVTRRLDVLRDGRRSADLVVRMDATDRVVPCLVGTAVAGQDGAGSRIVWVVVRAGTWMAAGSLDVTTVARAIGRLMAGPSATSWEADNADLHLSQVGGIIRQVTGVASNTALTVWQPNGSSTSTGTSSAVRAWGRTQLDLGVGPLVTARETGEVVRSLDVGGDPRTPALAGAVPGGHTAVACPVIIGGDVVGVVTAYDAASRFMDLDDLVLPSLVAAATDTVGRLRRRG